MANSQVGKMKCSVVKCFCLVVCVHSVSQQVCCFDVVVIVRWQNHLEKEDSSIEKGEKANNLDEVFSFESPLCVLLKFILLSRRELGWIDMCVYMSVTVYVHWCIQEHQKPEIQQTELGLVI